MSKPLFNQFQKVSAKEWKQRIQVELKGADFNEKLVTKTWEGIDIKPFYHKDETQFVSDAIPARNWSISERIHFTTKDESLATILDDYSRGAECIWLVVNKADAALVSMLEADTFPKIPVFIEFTCLDAQLVNQVIQVSKKHSLSIELGIDVLGKLASSGNWFVNQATDLMQFNSFVLEGTTSFSILVDARMYQEAGGTQVQQIAYALAHVNEYLEQLPDNFTSTFTLKIRLITSVGSNYFFEIAKLKALRWCLHSLTEGLNCKASVCLMTIPSKRNKTLYDYNVNMLRTSTEIMSAVLGGADEVTNLAYDHLYHESNEFGKRIARNQLLLLKNEAHLDKVENPSDGAYYLESLIEQFAQQGLGLFKQLEAGGGFIQQLFDGKIQEKLKLSAQKETVLTNEGKRVLVGTNKYANPEDRMLASLEKNPFKLIEKRKTLVQPIVPKRIAESIERERLNKEKAELQ